MRDFALIYVNGVRREIRAREALMMLADWLRKEAGMTGTKIVCAEGDCGSCTVLRANPLAVARAGRLDFEAVNSCIATMAQMDGCHIVTVEGMQCGDELSPAQVAMKQCHASQCGFCTPGFVMAMSGMLERHGGSNGATEEGSPKRDSCEDQRGRERTAMNYLTGNLCRCTGYQQIVHAAISARATEKHSVGGRYSHPAAIADSVSMAGESMLIEHDGLKFFAPATLREAATFAALNPGCRVLGAATDMGVQTNKGKPLPRSLLSLHLLPELYQVKRKRSGVAIGARVTLSQLRRECESSAPELSRFLDLFGSPQIKNVATLVGNIANASPIGDTLPFLLISGAVVHVAGRPDGKGALRRRAIDMGTLFTGYKKLAIDPCEIITHVTFAATDSREFLRLYKVSRRKDMDISAISGAFSMTLARRKKMPKSSGEDLTSANRPSKAAPMVESARIAFGGVAATPVRLPRVEAALLGEFTMEKAERVAQLISNSVTPLSDVRGSAAYRRVAAANLFLRYAGEVLHA